MDVVSVLKLRSDDVFTTVVDDETVILDAQRSIYLTVNPVGTVLLEALVRGASMEDLVSAAFDEFEVDRGVAERDVESFIGQLREHQLLDE